MKQFTNWINKHSLDIISWILLSMSLVFAISVYIHNDEPLTDDGIKILINAIIAGLFLVGAFIVSLYNRIKKLENKLFNLVHGTENKESL